MTRQAYWKGVVSYLTGMAIMTLDSKPLNWRAIEALAEYNGYSRKNIPLPRDMTCNAIAPMFRKWKTL
jgi:hypothetical protein